jgi:hypothetical protein
MFGKGGGATDLVIGMGEDRKDVHGGILTPETKKNPREDFSRGFFTS